MFLSSRIRHANWVPVHLMKCWHLFSSTCYQFSHSADLHCGCHPQGLVTSSLHLALAQQYRECLLHPVAIYRSNKTLKCHFLFPLFYDRCRGSPVDFPEAWDFSINNGPRSGLLSWPYVEASILTIRCLGLVRVIAANGRRVGIGAVTFRYQSPVPVRKSLSASRAPSTGNHASDSETGSGRWVPGVCHVPHLCRVEV